METEAAMGALVPLKLLAKHYVKGWFLLDFLVVAMNWIWWFYGTMRSLGEIGVLARLNRTLRVARMFKLQSNVLGLWIM